MKAPSLFDPALGTVHIWSKDGTVPTALAELIDSNVTRKGYAHSGELGASSTTEARIAFDYGPGRPPRGRFYVISGSVDRAAENSAALFGAPHGVTCLPTKKSPGAGQWLREQIAQRVSAGLDVLICCRGGAW